MREYKVGIWTRLHVCSICFGFLVLGIKLLIDSFNLLLELPFGELALYSFIMFVVIVLMVRGILDLLKQRIVIENDRITLIGPFEYKQLRLKEIKGYKISMNIRTGFFDDGRNIIIESIDKNKEKYIFINSYFSGKDEIIEWLKLHFRNVEKEKSLRGKKKRN